MACGMRVEVEVWTPLGRPGGRGSSASRSSAAGRPGGPGCWREGSGPWEAGALLGSFRTKRRERAILGSFLSFFGGVVLLLGLQDRAAAAERAPQGCPDLAPARGVVGGSQDRVPLLPHSRWPGRLRRQTPPGQAGGNALCAPRPARRGLWLSHLVSS